MKLLLDESVPRRLSATFPEAFRVYTVPQMGWSGTVDQGMAHEQNPGNLPVPVIFMLGVRNRLQELQPLVPQVIDILSRRPRKRIYHVSA